MEIEDDGRGFDLSIINSSNGRHYGLIGMRERAEKLGGRLFLTSAPGKGTQVRLSVPIIEEEGERYGTGSVSDLGVYQ